MLHANSKTISFYADFGEKKHYFSLSLQPNGNLPDLMKKLASYDEIPVSEFVDIIMEGGERADEAMYYLLHQRLNRQLHSRFEPYQHQLTSDFDDIVGDFFLYLREGKDDENHEAYQSVRRIRKRDSFESWMLSTFRNYLSTRAAKELQISSMVMPNESISDEEVSPSLLTDERKLDIASHLIAYAHQELPPRDGFIFLRSLLTMLNKQLALPNDEMAKALGMTDIAYRVSVHRMKCRLAKHRTLLLRGEPLALDEAHLLMAQRINDDFVHLYPTLMQYYGQTLDALQSADAVRQLRQDYLDASHLVLHEPESSYSTAPSVAAFWMRLSRFLVV